MYPKNALLVSLPRHPLDARFAPLVANRVCLSSLIIGSAHASGTCTTRRLNLEQKAAFTRAIFLVQGARRFCGSKMESLYGVLFMCPGVFRAGRQKVGEFGEHLKQGDNVEGSTKFYGNCIWLSEFGDQKSVAPTVKKIII